MVSIIVMQCVTIDWSKSIGHQRQATSLTERGVRGHDCKPRMEVCGFVYVLRQCFMTKVEKKENGVDTSIYRPGVDLG